MRESVRKFAEAMEAELKKHEHKGGWDNESLLYLLGQAKDNVRQLEPTNHGDQKAMVDAANYLMMAWEKMEKINKGLDSSGPREAFL